MTFWAGLRDSSRLTISGLSFIDGGTSPIRWRFPIGFQIIPLLVLLGAVWFFPESPRWLVKVGREDEARYILGRLRGESGADAQKADTELSEIKAVARLEKVEALPTSYLSMLLGRGSGDLHIGRRVQLVVWLQIFQEWVGIAGVTICESVSLLDVLEANETCRRPYNLPTFRLQFR